MRFSARGHEVSVVDNFSRRRWHTRALDRLADSDRLARGADRGLAARSPASEIQPFVGNIEDGEFLDRVVAETVPEAVIHYGEQPSAPYSMMSRGTRSRRSTRT